MIGFGQYNPFPFTIGGGDSDLEKVHESLLDYYAPGWDISEGTIKHTEAYAQALMISVIWACNKRLENQTIATKMLEQLPVWEEATRLRPNRNDLDSARRARLAAKLRGVANNTLTDITDACSVLLGNNFSHIETVAVADEVVYWPGVNPGPPGFEWSTNRCKIGVVVTRDGLSSGEYDLLRTQCFLMLRNMVPAWMTFNVGDGTSWIVNQGILGATFI